MLYVQRSDGTRRTLLLVNPATSPAAPTLDAGTLDAAWTDLLISGAQDSATMALPPMSVRILGALTPSRAARPLSTALAEARTRISNLERRPADR